MIHDNSARFLWPGLIWRKTRTKSNTFHFHLTEKNTHIKKKQPVQGIFLPFAGRLQQRRKKLPAGSFRFREAKNWGMNPGFVKKNPSGRQRSVTPGKHPKARSAYCKGRKTSGSRPYSWGSCQLHGENDTKDDRQLRQPRFTVQPFQNHSKVLSYLHPNSCFVRDSQDQGMAAQIRSARTAGGSTAPVRALWTFAHSHLVSRPNVLQIFLQSEKGLVWLVCSLLCQYSLVANTNLPQKIRFDSPLRCESTAVWNATLLLAKAKGNSTG